LLTDIFDSLSAAADWKENLVRSSRERRERKERREKSSCSIDSWKVVFAGQLLYEQREEGRSETSAERERERMSAAVFRASKLSKLPPPRP
jgi:hypothetical protein